MSVGRVLAKDANARTYNMSKLHSIIRENKLQIERHLKRIHDARVRWIEAEIKLNAIRRNRNGKCN